MSAAIEIKSFPHKQVDEDIVASFDYTGAGLATGETISSAVFSATVIKGIDAAPSNIISGVAAISGAICSQLIINGLDGVKYLIQCTATTSQSQVLHGLGYLTVTNTVTPK